MTLTLKVALEDAGKLSETGLLTITGAEGITRTEITPPVIDPAAFPTTTR